MKNICIITPSKDAISETFIQAHFQYLKGNIFILYGGFPNLYYNNQQIQLFYRKFRWLYRIKRLIPHFLYQKYIVPKEESENTRTDYITTFLKFYKIDVVLAEYGHSGALMFPYLKQLRIPLIVHFHGMDANHKWYLDRYMHQYKSMFSYASKIISVSKTMHKQLISYGSPSSKTILNPYGARSYFFDIQPQYSDLFISIGRFADTKAPYLTIMAFKLVVEVYPEAKFLFYGDGILREASINIAKAFGLVENIEFPGAVVHTDILKRLPDACCYVQHSITTTQGEMEGTPNSILEAQAASLPVISTKHAGINDAVVHGRTGYLVDELDYQTMGKYMLELIQNKAKCRKMGENARRFMESDYSFERYINNIQQIIDNC